jgi:hypothetical protein
MSCLKFSSVAATLLLSLSLMDEAHAKADLPPPSVRAGVINDASKLLQPRQYMASIEPADLINPFAPGKAPIIKDNKSLRPESDQDFLALLANQLNPTGVLMMGDQILLMFGEKKMKVGDVIKIPFDNQGYDVELVDIARTSFTVRLNNVEVTRPIKPAKAP